MKSKKDSGFTLYEVLVVVAIVVIIMSVVMRGVSSAKSKGRDARRAENIKTLQGAIENYFSVCFQYPSTLSAITVSGSCTGYVPVMTRIPTDPLNTSTSYGYYTDAPSTGKRYHLCATMENTFATKGKVTKAPFAGSDPCNGTTPTTFDVAGGIY